MSKSQKRLTQAEWEGQEAAQNGRGRSTNPYPQSDIAARNEWFAGYDRTIERLSRDTRSPRIRGY
jgi:ribosome modulation factor